LNLAADADSRLAFGRYAWLNEGVGANRHVAVAVGRGRVFDGDARSHQFVILSCSHDAAHFRQLAAAVDAADLVGVLDGHRRYGPPALAVDGYQVGQVVFALRVLGGDGGDGVEQAREGERVDARID